MQLMLGETLILLTLAGDNVQPEHSFARASEAIAMDQDGLDSFDQVDMQRAWRCSMRAALSPIAAAMSSQPIICCWVSSAGARSYSPPCHRAWAASRGRHADSDVTRS
jgi:hypothetical protein